MSSSEMFAQLYLISALLFVLFRANRSFTIIIFFQERVYGFHHLPHALNCGYSVHVPQNTIGSHCSLLTLFRYQRFAIK